MLGPATAKNHRMGLLDKSTKLREEPPGDKGGLLARASASRESDNAEQETGETPGAVGLLARAEEMGQDAAPAGLLSRASALHDEAPTATESSIETPVETSIETAAETDDAFAGEIMSDAELEAELTFDAPLDDMDEAELGDQGAVDFDPAESDTPEIHGESRGAEFESNLDDDVALDVNAGLDEVDAAIDTNIDDEIDEAAVAYAELNLDEPEPGADGSAEDFAADRGLLARAEALQEEEPAGLLARAEELQNESSDASEVSTEAASEVSTEAATEAGGGLLARAEESRAEEDADIAEYAEVDKGEILADDLLPDLDFSDSDETDSIAADAVGVATAAAAGGLLARAEALHDSPDAASADLAADEDTDAYAEVDRGEILSDDLLPDLDFSDDSVAAGDAPETLPGAPDADEQSSGLLARAAGLREDNEDEAEQGTPQEDPQFAALHEATDELTDKITDDITDEISAEVADELDAPLDLSAEGDLHSPLDLNGDGDLDAPLDLDNVEDLDDDLDLDAPVDLESAGDLEAPLDLDAGDDPGEPATLETGADEPAIGDVIEVDEDADLEVDLESHPHLDEAAADDTLEDIPDEPVLLGGDDLETVDLESVEVEVADLEADEPVGSEESAAADEDEIDLDAPVLDADGEAVADNEDGLPNWDYDGPDSPDDDPFLLDNAAEAEEKLFEDWEDEAEFEAERGIKELEGRPVQESSVNREIMLEADSEFTTVPDEIHIASQKKIDNYLSLFDITKEISTIDDFDNLWDAILYAVMGQVGAETICIFSTTKRGGDSAFEPVAHSGFSLPDGWSFRTGDRIYDTLQASPEIKYAQEFLQNNLAGQERSILETTRANIVVPLKNQERTYGILVLGGQISGDEYSLDDLEFLNLLGEISAVGVDRVLSRLEYEQDTSDLKRRTAINKKIFELSRQSSNARTIDEIYDTLSEHLIEDFQVESFSLVLLDARVQEYKIFAGNQISPASLEKFSLGVSSDLVGMISNLTHVYELTDFRENQEITRNYTNDDLGLMQNYWIVPLINLNWLVGFLTIHKSARSWSDFQREMLVTLAEIMAPVFANSIILGERETLFRDPFSPLESRLRTELKKAAEFEAPVSLLEIRVKNIKRLLALNPAETVSEFLTVLGRSIAGFLFETDFVARIGQGRFALILPGRGGEEAEIFVKKLRSEFKRVGMLPGSPIDVQYSHQIITAPHDTDDPEKILSLLD